VIALHEALPACIPQVTLFAAQRFRQQKRCTPADSAPWDGTVELHVGNLGPGAPRHRNAVAVALPDSSYRCRPVRAANSPAAQRALAPRPLAVAIEQANTGNRSVQSTGSVSSVHSSSVIFSTARACAGATVQFPPPLRRRARGESDCGCARPRASDQLPAFAVELRSPAQAAPRRAAALPPPAPAPPRGLPGSPAFTVSSRCSATSSSPSSQRQFRPAHSKCSIRRALPSSPPARARHPQPGQSRHAAPRSRAYNNEVRFLDCSINFRLIGFSKPLERCSVRLQAARLRFEIHFDRQNHGISHASSS